jgi:long-chain acyl-CoA synthetase
VGAYHLAALAESALERAGQDHRTLFFEGRWWTSGELFERAARLAGGLRSRGVMPGDRVVVLMANEPDVLVVYQAIWRMGAVATPVIFLLPPEEIGHILRDSGATAVVTSPEFLANVRAAAQGSDITIVCAGTAPEGVLGFDELMSADAIAVEDRQDDDLAALLYTGGTTGRSKGVMLTHRNLWHAGQAGYLANVEHHLTRTVVPLPLSHSFGLLVTVTGQHAQEPGTTVLLRWFEPAAFLGAIEEHQLEQATVVPTMLRLLLAAPLEDHDLSSLQRLVCGSAPLPVDVAQEFERRVPNARILEGYGLTECAAATTVNRHDNRRMGTVGLPLPGIDLRLVDETDRDVPQGSPGEVLVRSETVMPGYWGDEQATAAAFTADGWLRTGDIGVRDQDGFLSILDRKKDLIIRNGFNVYPRDVEDALTAHPDVQAAGVIGRPDDAVGEEIVAFVVPAPGGSLDPSELRGWAKEHIGGKGYPRDVRVIEQLPLTPVMKVDRKALRGQL